MHEIDVPGVFISVFEAKKVGDDQDSAESRAGDATEAFVGQRGQTLKIGSLKRGSIGEHNH